MRAYKINIFASNDTAEVKFRSLKDYLKGEGLRIGWNDCTSGIGQMIVHTPLTLEEVRSKIRYFDLNYTLAYCQ